MTEELQLKLEELGLDKEKVQEVMDSLGEKTVDNFLPVDKPVDKSGAVSDLQVKIMNEKDWRKRAQMAAQIISLRFED